MQRDIRGGILFHPRISVSCDKIETCVTLLTQQCQPVYVELVFVQKVFTLFYRITIYLTGLTH